MTGPSDRAPPLIPRAGTYANPYSSSNSRRPTLTFLVEYADAQDLGGVGEDRLQCRHRLLDNVFRNIIRSKRTSAAQPAPHGNHDRVEVLNWAYWTKSLAVRLSCSPESEYGSKSYDDVVWETAWFAALIGAIFGVGVVSPDVRVTKEARR
jgi:hypothetical protein